IILTIKLINFKIIQLISVSPFSPPFCFLPSPLFFPFLHLLPSNFESLLPLPPKSPAFPPSPFPYLPPFTIIHICVLMYLY
nr:hypothetical ORF-7 protein - Leishmania tarentolae mitochondrion [Leishmania tarentolae]